MSPEQLARLQNPDWINEGIGVEGFQYPDSDIYKDRTAKWEYDETVLRQIGEMAIAHSTGDTEAAENCGKLILGNLLNYTQEK